jgi:hypothetical protein
MMDNQPEKNIAVFVLLYLSSMKRNFSFINCDWLIDWCLIPTLAIFQPYHSMLSIVKNEK